MLRARLLQSFLIIVAVVLAPAATVRLPVAAERAIAGVAIAELRSHVETLASDEFAGRGVGHEGNRKAELYVAGVLRDAGARPVLDDTFFQPVVVYQPVLGTGSRLTITRESQRLLELTAGDDLYPVPDSGAGTAHGRVVFAGYGISAPAQRYDDFAKQDVRGAIVMILDGAPPQLGDADEETYSVGRKASNAVARGAAGVIVLTAHLSDVRNLWPEKDASIRSAAYQLFSDVQRSGVPVLAVRGQAADSVRRAAEAGTHLTATVTAAVSVRPVTMHNVLGMVEGRDGSRDEMVVVGAHFDHDGIDASGRIYNGADDNASGTAAVMSIAAAFARAAANGERPQRAVVFALWNGEEKGSLGAEAYVDDPRPPRRIVANINLDMIGRAENVPDPDDPRFRGFARTSPAQSANVVHLLGYTYSADLAGIVADANSDIGLRIKQDYDQGAQGLLHRSDNWPFLRRGIPAVFLTTGLHPDYHTPDDDVERIDFSKLERITRLAARAAWLTADGPPPRLRKR